MKWWMVKTLIYNFERVFPEIIEERKSKRMIGFN